MKKPNRALIAGMLESKLPLAYVFRAFAWAETPQGHNYWARLYNRHYMKYLRDMSPRHKYVITDEFNYMLNRTYEEIYDTGIRTIP